MQEAGGSNPLVPTRYNKTLPLWWGFVVFGLGYGVEPPDRLTGLALVDKDKGIVGYCLYDKDERSIYDMAVLPEYRTDKNASSRKLFAEVIKKIKEIDGEWVNEQK